jgi:hypothetical protein
MQEILGHAHLYVDSNNIKDVVQLYRSILQRWKPVHGRFFCYKASSSFDMFPFPRFTFSNLFEANLQSYSSMAIAPESVNMVTGVLVPIDESRFLHEHEALRYLFDGMHRNAY